MYEVSKAEEAERSANKSRLCCCLKVKSDDGNIGGNPDSDESSSSSAKWTAARFFGLCLAALIILLGAYGLKSDSSHGEHRR